MQSIRLAGVALVLAVGPLAGAQPRATERAACDAARNAYTNEQVERPAALIAGGEWPSEWQEQTFPPDTARGFDARLRQSGGLAVWRSRRGRPLPERWVAFVVDSTGAVPHCSVRAFGLSLSAAELERAVSRRRFRPAEVGGRRVPQLILMAVGR